MTEIGLGRVVNGTRVIPRDVLMGRAACVATGLGDAIGVVLRNDFAFFEASFAAQRLSAYSLPVNLLPEVALAIPPRCCSLSCRRCQVMTFLRERLADFKVPRVIKFETALPREDSGKIIKRKLREPYCADIGRNI